MAVSPEHRLRAGRRDGNEAVLALDGVAEMPKVTLHLDLLDLEVEIAVE